MSVLPPTPHERSSQLHDLIRRLSRPIEFASRDQYAHVSSVKDLGPFVRRQVVEALAQGPHAVKVEVNLLALRTLFEDFEVSVDLDHRRRCLEQARLLLRHLRSGVPAPGLPVSPEQSVGREPPAEASASQTPLCDSAIQYVKGVGPKRAAMLARLGIRTIEDLLWTIPWRYEDRTRVTRIDALLPGQRAMISAVVRRSRLKTITRRRMTVLEVTLEDAVGQAMAVFYNQPYLQEQLLEGTPLLVSGRVSSAVRGAQLPWAGASPAAQPLPRIDAEEYEILRDPRDVPIHLGGTVPIYHETRGWSSRQMRALMRPILEAHGSQVPEVLPEAVRHRQKLPLLSTAIAALHWPSDNEPIEALNDAATPAHRRLAFEELFLLELALAHRRQFVIRGTKPFRIEPSPGMRHRLRALLPFQLTNAQQRVIDEVLRDMVSPHPMNRLIQGDVGSGKTIVAVHALAAACASGMQAVLMAPTELLAEQHALNIAPLCEQLGLSLRLLSGKERGAARRERLEEIAQGRAQVIVGTHAVLQQSVRFAQLGLAVIDEQHKFGVLQRKMLVDKGYQPDVLIMTATPIPRTLAMTVYGDLDVSVIDTLPPGRKSIQTIAYPASHRQKAYQIVIDELRAGRQAYIVYPLVEESEKVDLEAAEKAFARLQQEPFAAFRVGLVHGKLKAEERSKRMMAFKSKQLDILVATTVIEVGVDVPNATVMVIEHAERFGLAQLHQLRGRVGRGADQSYCVLVDHTLKEQGHGARGATELSPAAQRREVMLRSTDGFVIAEEDLRIRGPGEMFGTRQSGLPEFRAANLIRDAALVEIARKEAFALFQDDPDLSRAEHRLLGAVMRRRWQSKLQLGDVS